MPAYNPEQIMDVAQKLEQEADSRKGQALGALKSHQEGEKTFNLACPDELKKSIKQQIGTLVNFAEGYFTLSADFAKNLKTASSEYASNEGSSVQGLKKLGGS